jgi:biopolymer transport protein TolR
MGASMNQSGGGRGRSRRRAFVPMSEINVTPMVDVMLVLLIIFMVAAPLLTAGVEVNLPESAAGPINANEEPLEVYITKSGDIKFQETDIKLTDLVAKISAVLDAKPGLPVYVKGDKDINYGRVMQVMGKLNAGGITKVALVTEPED